MVDSLFFPDVTQANDDRESLQDFISLFLLLVLITKIGRQSEFKIPLIQPSGRKLFLRPVVGYKKGSINERVLMSLCTIIKFFVKALWHYISVK